MTQVDLPMLTSGQHLWKRALLVLIRLTLSLSVLALAYCLLPTRGRGDGTDIPWLILALCVFAGVIAIQVPAIIRAKNPVLRAVEAMTLLVAVYLLIFARIYLSASVNDPSTFTLPLNHAVALYFTVTVFATVGFGDIVAQTDGMRLLVTLQMVVNLIVLGVVIRLLTSAARQGIAMRRGQADVHDGSGPISD
jgi:voltage-gated potassium channel